MERLARLALPHSPFHPIHSGGSPGENLKSVFHRCYLREVAFECELTQEIFYLPLGCLQGGVLEYRFRYAEHISSVEMGVDLVYTHSVKVDAEFLEKNPS